MKIHSHARQFGAARSIETAAISIPDGKALCSACERVVGLTPNKHLRRHNDRRGVECSNRISGHEEATGLTAEVEMPTPTRGKRPAAMPKPPSEPSRLDVGSNCVECGKWLPGERSLCGRCYATGERGRTRK